MKRFLYVLVLLAAAGVVLFGLDHKAGGKYMARLKVAVTKIKGQPAKINWTPEMIAQDPEGYLAYAEASVQQQIGERQARLVSLAQRKTEIQQKSTAFSTKLKDIENVYKRLSSAAQKAEDEDRWPVKVGGKTFDKETAKAVLASAKQWIDERRPLASAYVDASQRITGVESTMRADIEKLTQLKDKVGVDLERVRLNKGMAEMQELKKTEEVLASFSSVLADMTQDPIAGVNLPGSDGPKNVDVEQLLK